MLRRSLGVEFVRLMRVDEAKVWSGDKAEREKCLQEVERLYQEEEITPGQVERVVSLALNQDWDVLPPVRGIFVPLAFAPLFALQLNSDDASARKRALEGLSRIGAKEYAKPISDLLDDPSEEVVVYAIHAIAVLAPDHAEDIRPFLGHENRSLRFAALSALGEMRSRESARDVAALLEAKDEFVRMKAIETLQEIEARQYGPKIRELLKDPSAIVRARAVDALSALEGRKHADEILVLLKDSQPEVRQAVLSVIQEFRLVEAIPQLAKMVESDTECAPMAMMVLHQIGGLDITPLFVKYFQNPDLREEAMSHLRDRGVERVRADLEALGDSARPLLVGVLPLDRLREWTKHADPDVRKSALNELGYRGDPEDGSLLEKLLKEDSDADVRWAALMSLINLNPPGAARKILQLLPLPDWRRNYMVSLFIGKTGATDCGDELDRLLHSATPSARETGCRAAGSLRSDAHAKLIAGLLRDPEASVRLSAAAALESLSDFDRASLVPLLRDPDLRVVEQALVTLGMHRAGEHAEAVLDLLSGPLREHAVYALRAMGAREHAARVAPLLGDPKSQVRIAAIRYFSDLQLRDYVDEIALCASDQRVHVRTEAVQALGRLQAKKYTDLLKRLVGDPKFFGDVAVAQALADLHGADSLPWIRGRLARSFDGKAFRLLGSLGDRESLELILRKAYSVYDEISEGAILGLVRLAPHASDGERSRIVAELKSLESSPQRRVRSAAACALIRLGAKDRAEERKCLNDADRRLIHALNEHHEFALYQELSSIWVESLGLVSELADLLEKRGIELKATQLPLWGRSPRMRLMDCLEEWLRDDYCVVLEQKTVRILRLKDAREHWGNRLR